MTAELAVKARTKGTSPQGLPKSLIHEGRWTSCSCPFSADRVGRILQTFKIKKTVEATRGRLNSYLADIDRQAQERFERLIEGILNINRVWLIPKGAVKPADARKKINR